MSYLYDAFFSYKRDRESDAWHERVKDKLAFWLKHELGQLQVPIFFDTTEIRGGMQWSQALTHGLRRSKCLICFWSPLYFQSKWCVSEWLTFAERSRKLDRQLILPASYFDGENFPARAREIQFRDFSEFASTLPRFWDTEAAVRFEEQRIRPFARDLAALIRQAPPFDDSFPLIVAPDEQVLPEPAIGRIADV